MGPGPDGHMGGPMGPDMGPSMNGMSGGPDGMDGMKNSPANGPGTPREDTGPPMGDYGMPGGYEENVSLSSGLKFHEVSLNHRKQEQNESAAIRKIKESMQEEAKRFEKETPDHPDSYFMQ